MERLLAAADDHDVDAIALLGDLGDLRGERTNGYSFFHALARASRPVFWVPGAADVPSSPTSGQTAQRLAGSEHPSSSGARPIVCGGDGASL